MPFVRRAAEGRLTLILWLDEIDIIPLEQQFCPNLMPSESSALEWGLTLVVWLVGIDIVARKQ